MSDVVIASNITTKVNRAINGATAVNANCYAVVEYYMSGYGGTVQNTTDMTPKIFTRHFGPNQAIPSSFQLNLDPDVNNSGPVVQLSYSILTGVEYINSP